MAFSVIPYQTQSDWLKRMIQEHSIRSIETLMDEGDKERCDSYSTKGTGGREGQLKK